MATGWFRLLSVNAGSLVSDCFAVQKSMTCLSSGDKVQARKSMPVSSATSQLDGNAWQRVATYKSGSKQTWCRIFFVWNIEKAQTDRTPAQLPLC